MQVTNGQIWQAREPIQDLTKERLPVKTALALVQLGRVLSQQMAVIDEVRVKLIKQYGGINSRGLPEITPDHSTWSAFEKEFNELMGEEVTVGNNPVKVLATNGMQLTAADIVRMEPFVEFVEGDEPTK